MSNVLTGNPFLLDTASTSAVLTTLKLRVGHIHWQGATANDVLILKDAAGNTKFQGTATGADMYWDHIGEFGGSDWAGLIAYQIPHGLVQLVYK